MKFQPTSAAIFLLAITGGISAQVDFTQQNVTQVTTEAQLRTAAGAANTARIDGVAVRPGAEGELFAIHVDSANNESFLRIDPTTGVGITLTNQSVVLSQLGAPYAGALTLVGGFVYSPAANALYFAEDFTSDEPGEVSLIRINASTGASSLVSRSTDLEGLNDHTVLPDGAILVTRPEDGLIGTVNPTNGDWTVRLTDDQLIAAAPGTTELPPESIASNPVGGETYIFCHDDLVLFRVPNITDPSPTITPLEDQALENLDMHDLAVDEAGNMYGFNVPTNSIIIIRESDDAVFSFPLANIGTQLGNGAFSGTFWRGIAARTVSATQTDLFLASGDSNYGVVRVRFGAPSSSVDSWTLY